MLAALASLHPRPLTRNQLATLAGMSPGSGTFSTYLGHLRHYGFMADEGAELAITDDGLEHLGDDVPAGPRSTEELVELFRRRLKLGARRLLDALVEAYPRGLSRDELAAAVEMAPSSGTFSTYLGHLRRNGLVDVPRGGGYSASETLFIGGRR
jgi:DNA-binding IclR family transcriptional regulator